MPRAKKPFGTAADPRNGQQALLALPTQRVVEPFDPPEGLHPRVVEAWEAYWSDKPSYLLTPASVIVLRRWAHAMHRYVTLLADADENPYIAGARGQDRINPLYAVAENARSAMEHCERQLGIGVLNAANLGIAALTEQRGAAALSSNAGGGDSDRGPRADPRVIDAA